MHIERLSNLLTFRFQLQGTTPEEQQAATRHQPRRGREVVTNCSSQRYTYRQEMEHRRRMSHWQWSDERGSGLAARRKGHGGRGWWSARRHRSGQQLGAPVLVAHRSEARGAPRSRLTAHGIAPQRGTAARVRGGREKRNCAKRAAAARFCESIAS